MIKDPFIDIKELEKELKDIQKIAELLDINFSILNQKIAYLFSKIKNCENFQEANQYFSVLDLIQETLSCLLYKYHVGLPDRLRRFVHDLDNLEPIYREHYFKKITSGEYSF